MEIHSLVVAFRKTHLHFFNVMTTLPDVLHFWKSRVSSVRNWTTGGERKKMWNQANSHAEYFKHGQQDYVKTTPPNFMKLGEKVKHGWRKNYFKFGVDPDYFI